MKKMSKKSKVRKKVEKSVDRKIKPFRSKDKIQKKEPKNMNKSKLSKTTKSMDKKSVGKSMTKKSTIKDKSPSKNQKEEKRTIPQNFNSYRHVITRATTGDDIKWVLNLRDSSTPLAKMTPTNSLPFQFGDKLTESLKNRKTAKEYEKIGNPYDVDHLTRKRVGTTYPNFASGYFESGLRRPRDFKINKVQKKNFWRYAKRDKKELPMFMHKAKTHKMIKHKIKTQESDIEKLEKPLEKFIQRRKLPKLFYSAFEGRYEEAPLEFYEARNKINANMQMTEHLYPKGDITTLKWEVSLRQKFENPWKKKKKRKRDRLSVSLNKTKKRT